jgi:hypothetical protein
MFYTGVGSRRTPVEVQKLMTETARRLEDTGYVLRSGGAEGADQAFERGVKNPKNKEIFYAGDSTHEAEKIASYIHPAWDKCSPLAKKLHGRNVFQVMGSNFISPSELLVCWTEDGKLIGGTRTAIVLAQNYRIPVYNLGAEDGLSRLDDFFALGNGPF